MRYQRMFSLVGAALTVPFWMPSSGGAQTVLDLPAQDRPLGVEKKDVFSVGSMMGEEWETFARIRGVAFDRAGNLYILDADNFRVVKVDPQGRRLAEMGRQGGGPEIPQTRLLHLFTLEDEVQSTVLYEGWNPAARSRMEMTGGGGISFQAPPVRAFDPELLAGVLPDGEVAVVDSSTYEVQILELDGTVNRVLRRDLQPREVTGRDEEIERRRRLEEMALSGGPQILMRTSDGATTRMSSEQARKMIENRIEGMEFAPEIPVLIGMGVDWEGRLWLQRSGPRIGEEGPLDLVTGGGEYLGTLLPGELRIPDAFGPGGLAAFIEEDELGVPRVMVKRLSTH